MFSFKLLDKTTGNVFYKDTDSYYLAFKFNNKLKRSKKLQLLTTNFTIESR